MHARIKLSNTIHLGIQTTFIFLTVKYLILTMHELGHCFGGWLVGLRPVGFYVGFFGGGGSYIFGSGSFWQNLLMTAAGPTLEFTFGIISFFLILPRMKRWGWQLFWLYAATITIFSFWVYMVIGGFLGYGDFAQIASILGVGRYGMGVLGFAGLVGFAFMLGRRIFAAFSPYFFLGFYWNRFVVMFLFIGVPGIINTGGGYFFSPYGSLSQFLLVLSIVIFITCLFSFFKQASGASIQDLPKLPSLIGIFTLGIVISIWLGLFGPTSGHAKGILWSVPEEERPQACNITISLKQDFSARIDFLMRPYTNRLFWEKVKHRTPNWPAYTKFIEKNLPVMLGISDYRIVEKINDTTSSFYHGTDDLGARRISIVLRLDESMKKIGESTYVLDITDFWRIKRGYVEKMEILLDEGMRFSGYELTPDHAKKPDRYDDRTVVWENTDASAPEKIRLMIFRSSRKG